MAVQVVAKNVRGIGVIRDRIPPVWRPRWGGTGVSFENTQSSYLSFTGATARKSSVILPV